MQLPGNIRKKKYPDEIFGRNIGNEKVYGLVV